MGLSPYEELGEPGATNNRYIDRQTTNIISHMIEIYVGEGEDKLYKQI
jgi:hypothetical protein